MMPALPAIERAALLLDLDGTLLDIAPTPDAVMVPPGLPDVLRTLRGLLGDAVAVVTGRPVETVERLLGDAVYAVAGEHGGAIRYSPSGRLGRPPLPPVPDAWLEVAERLAAAHPGALLERKARGFALHYRAVPSVGLLFRERLMELLKDSAEFELLAGHMIWEDRPRGINKGKAVTDLMERAPFRGRLPVFIGDDETDKDGIAAVQSLGGTGLWVPDLFGDAAGVRVWLRDVATNRQWGG
jgi:trehalose 6-phosphate phosphatase